jgi:hypothetical protein
VVSHGRIICLILVIICVRRLVRKPESATAVVLRPER